MCYSDSLLLSLFQLPLSFLTQILLIKLAGFLPPPVSCFISTTFSQAAQTERRSRAEQRLDSWRWLCCCLLSVQQPCERRFLEEPFDTQYESKAICESTLMPTNADVHVKKKPQLIDSCFLSLNPTSHLQQ